MNPGSSQTKPLSPEEVQARNEARERAIAEHKQRSAERTAKLREVKRDVALKAKQLLTKTKLAIKKIAKGRF